MRTAMTVDGHSRRRREPCRALAPCAFTGSPPQTKVVTAFGRSRAGPPDAVIWAVLKVAHGRGGEGRAVAREPTRRTRWGGPVPGVGPRRERCRARPRLRGPGRGR